MATKSAVTEIINIINRPKIVSDAILKKSNEIIPLKNKAVRTAHNEN